jgi:hypothetical protein
MAPANSDWGIDRPLVTSPARIVYAVAAEAMPLTLRWETFAATSGVVGAMISPQIPAGRVT